MNSKLFAGAAVTTVIAASVIASPVFAWHPKGVIIKYVQNQTTNGAMSDANDAAHAVAAKPGDVLKYTIKVSNNGSADERGYNDMAKVVMTDTLPAGVELVSDAAQRSISVDMGTIKPGANETREYLVKVTAGKDGVVENKACFTGDSTANDNPQKGCDVADIKVTVPPVTPPQPPVTPVPPVQPAPSSEGATAPTELPATGPVSIVGGVAGVTSLGYAAHAYLRSKRALANSHKR